MLDQATTIRSGEELNTESLLAFFQTTFPAIDERVEITQFPSGFSNLTYLLRMADQEWVLRRPPFGANVKSGHDMSREFKVLSGLRTVYKQVPTPVLLCEDSAVLGAPFYLMERVSGVIIRKKIPVDFKRPDLLQRLSEETIDNLAIIHQLDIETAGLANLGRPIGYVERQIRGWTRRYANAKTDEIPQMDTVSDWLERNRPSEVTSAIVHNDYKLDNLILDPNTLSIKAVLDWEMATVGCPMMDLGCSLAYWVQADDPPEFQFLPLSATKDPGSLTRQQAVDRYCQRTGFPTDNLPFYYAYGLWRLAIIIQQIYARYKRGHTKDPRFAILINGVKILAQQAIRVIDSQRISVV